MSIIVYTDFIGQISIPNSAPAHTEGANLAIFITDYEDKFLTDVLGYKMSKDFTTAIAANPTSGVWFDLWKGAEFTDSLGRLNLWPGFRNTAHQLSIANFIYTKYIEATQTNTTGIGEKATNATNAVTTTPIEKVCRAWNKMVDLNYILHDFILANISDYPDYIGINGFSPIDYVAGNYEDRIGNRNYFIKRNVLGI